MSSMHDQTEARRLALQADLDSLKTGEERNKLGQFATPTALARDLLRYAATLIPETDRVRFLDPAIGTGAFYSALRSVFPAKRIESATGFEIDPHYATPAEKLWQKSPLKLHVEDFTKAKPSPRHNLLICNPPYVRHHHLTGADKSRLGVSTRDASGMKLSGLAGLYCHFLGLAHSWMSPAGVAGWLIPSEFMDVNYGRAVKRYLLEEVTLLHIHRFDPLDAQFSDALVSSAVVWFRNSPPPKNHAVKFSYGGTLLEPRETRSVPATALATEAKWSRFPVSEIRAPSDVPTLSDFFRVKRGIATGDNGYFILAEDELHAKGLPFEMFTPILPSPRYLQADEVNARPDGTPELDRRLFLLDTTLNEEKIRVSFPALFDYLEEGKAAGLHERYLCSHRAVWYAQEQRPPAPIVCTYLGRGDTKRGKPFRFILNNSRATVANVYLAMYPTPVLAQAIAEDPEILRAVWQILNDIDPAQLLGEGRVYGGGLHKLEPRELANVPAAAIADLLPSFSQSVQSDFLAELVAVQLVL